MTPSTEQLILDQLKDLNEVVREGLANAHKRINPLEAWQAGANEKLKSLRGRVNWLYFIVGSAVTGVIVAKAMGG